uniref:Uncharacterized protein n=1 Tax=Salix viminalis TaxID=40686 RepID=A0A6N2MTU8_SALVM
MLSMTLQQLLEVFLSYFISRYVEAYHVHSKLKSVEEEFISENSLSEEVLSRMRSASSIHSVASKNSTGRA